MNTMLDKMQEKLSPIAMKVGNQKFLVALRDSFVGTMPVIMTGSIALLLNFSSGFTTTISPRKYYENLSVAC
ncbi:PTS system transporter subunit IIC [Streptococcus pneumoniae]|nr:PTS system transporter subunit IIC [Streptococcus pneumoniae]